MARIRTTPIENADEIAVLASPTRIEIVDMLEAMGDPVSVAELARAIGRPADSLYYHLRQLVDGGLIEEVSAPDGRRYRPHKAMRLRYRPGATANADAVGRVAASMLRVAGRDFSRAIACADTVAEGPRRELWAARGKGWVDDDTLAEINRLLQRLMELVQQPVDARKRAKRRLIALSWVLAPLQDKTKRRGTSP